MFKKSIMVLMTPDQKSVERLRNFLLDKGLSVYVASNFEDAVRVMKTKAVDLLICDTFCLEKVNHDELRAQLASQAKEGELPLILISADVGPNSKSWFKKFSGVKALVPRPVDLNQVYRLVKANIEKDGPMAFDLTDMDEDKPFVDPADRRGIEIVSRVVRVVDGIEDQAMEASLIELGEGSVLLEVRGKGLAQGDRLKVRIVTSGVNSAGEINFEGGVLSVEETDSAGALIVTVDSQQAASAISTQLGEEVKKRQDDLADFIRRSKG